MNRKMQNKRATLINASNGNLFLRLDDYQYLVKPDLRDMLFSSLKNSAYDSVLQKRETIALVPIEVIEKIIKESLR
jgi:hypothetical protein